MKRLVAFVKRHLQRGFKFALVGTIGALINLVVLYVLTDIFKVWYIVSAIIGILVGFIHNYFLNTIWTYRDAMKALDEHDKHRL